MHKLRAYCCNNPRMAGVYAILLSLITDQITKEWLLGVVNHGDVLPIFPHFNIVMVWNYGISFGLLHDVPYNQYFLPVLSLIIVIFLLGWLKRSETRYLSIALGLIVGGAIGNVIDRLRFGAVADFFDFYYGTWHYPAFNIADACICVGAFMIILESLFSKKSSPKGGDVTPTNS